MQSNEDQYFTDTTRYCHSVTSPEGTLDHIFSFQPIKTFNTHWHGPHPLSHPGELSILSLLITLETPSFIIWSEFWLKFSRTKTQQRTMFRCPGNLAGHFGIKSSPINSGIVSLSESLFDGSLFCTQSNITSQHSSTELWDPLTLNPHFPSSPVLLCPQNLTFDQPKNTQETLSDLSNAESNYVNLTWPGVKRQLVLRQALLFTPLSPFPSPVYC